MNDPVIVQAIAAGIVIAVLSVVAVCIVVIIAAAAVTIAGRIANKIDEFRTRHAA